MDSLETMAELEKYAKRIMTKKTISFAPIAYSLKKSNAKKSTKQKKSFTKEKELIAETEQANFFAKKENPRPCVVHSQEEIDCGNQESEEAPSARIYH